MLTGTLNAHTENNAHLPFVDISNNNKSHSVLFTQILLMNSALGKTFAKLFHEFFSQRYLYYFFRENNVWLCVSNVISADYNP